jgi:glycogen operon protein
LFEHHGRRAWASVNYVACHDGFTLADTTSYAWKHNEANGESNNDGQSDNCSANWGVEGPTDDPAIGATRARVRRAMLATMFLAAGTPMLLAGDEFGHSQRGNNNAYCQDNEISWLDWHDAARPENRELTAFVARLAALRRAQAVLRTPAFLHGTTEPAPGVADIAWFDEHGDAMSPAAWNDPAQQTLILRRAMKDGDGRVTILTLLLNPTAEDRRFRLPPPAMPAMVVLDSAAPDAGDVPVGADGVLVAAQSAVLVLA